MQTRFLIPLFAALLLSACGNSTSGALEGKWANDCVSPFVAFNGNTIHVYPDDADYALKTILTMGNSFTVTYDSKTGPVTETYILENETLRLDKGTYGGMQAVWHKQPMMKCP